MVEDELVEILTEYKTIAESEHNSFVSTLVNNPNFAQVVFNSLQGFEERGKGSDVLGQLCDLLFSIYRRDPEYKSFALQFLPHLAFIYLLNYGEKDEFGCIETWLIGIHNIESADTSSFRIPSLNQNSIYHESNQILESRQSSLSEMERGPGITVKRIPPMQIKSFNSMNKMPVIAFLFSVYTGRLPDIQRISGEYTCKLCSRMITRGFNFGTKKGHRRNLSYGSDSGMRSPRVLPNRLHLSSALLLEILQIGHWAIFNQCFGVGMHLIRDIEFRARHSSMDSVLLVSRALLQMAPNGPSIEEQRYISTPSQLSKNIITNASFRTKKLEGDIPRLEDDEGPSSLESKMTIITEEEEEGGQETRKGRDMENIADKIKARMENVLLLS
ncbi:hyccin-like isoform X2 [Eurytemora carolleeae]|uniref:hyccin-like isoform X2 n=1 Tax=Eurytemora carolleeae TaxID=1294199 RepID=UPI000C785B2B|nr:hyccin-like isoform X2 [Eurytemora carolleeae]|eukprot:XP_023339775.1 hyccin-like isoform X2 [Eurytemora affinis]